MKSTALTFHRYLTVSNNCKCSLTEQNITLKNLFLMSDTNVKQNTILKIAIRFCLKIVFVLKMS